MGREPELLEEGTGTFSGFFREPGLWGTGTLGGPECIADCECRYPVNNDTEEMCLSTFQEDQLTRCVYVPMETVDIEIKP